MPLGLEKYNLTKGRIYTTLKGKRRPGGVLTDEDKVVNH